MFYEDFKCFREGKTYVCTEGSINLIHLVIKVSDAPKMLGDVIPSSDIHSIAALPCYLRASLLPTFPIQPPMIVWKHKRKKLFTQSFFE